MAGHIRFKGFTTLSKPSILSAKHNLSKSPNSPLGQPFLSNHYKTKLFGIRHILGSVDKVIPRLVSEQSARTQEQVPKFRTKQIPNI